MGWDESADLLLGNCMEAFGGEELVTYTPVTGTPRQIKAIFDESYRELDPQTGATFTSQHPVLGVKLNDLPAASPRNGDQVTVKGTVYKVIEPQHDGQGGAILRLHKV